MGSIVAILLFLLSLITSLLLKFSVVYALVIGYIIFIIYELWKRKNKIFIFVPKIYNYVPNCDIIIEEIGGIAIWKNKMFWI